MSLEPTVSNQRQHFQGEPCSSQGPFGHLHSEKATELEREISGSGTNAKVLNIRSYKICHR